MSLAEKLGEKCQKTQIQRPPLYYTEKNIKKAKQYCEDRRQDWACFVTGIEGSGKSTFATHLAHILDPNFSVNESMIYNFNGEEHSFIEFMQKYRTTPFKVSWLDEAVTVLFSHRHSTKESADAQELFKLKRNCCHYDILVSPSPWDIVPDIRERRVKSLFYTFVRVYHPAENKTVYKNFVAHFSGSKIIEICSNGKTKLAFRSPDKLFKLVKPDFIEEFPPMAAGTEKEYLKSKDQHLLSRIEKAAGTDPQKGINGLLKPAGGIFDPSALEKKLSELN